MTCVAEWWLTMQVFIVNNPATAVCVGSTLGMILIHNIVLYWHNAHSLGLTTGTKGM